MTKKYFSVMFFYIGSRFDYCNSRHKPHNVSGNAIKTLTTKRVPVFREDIRVVKFKMKEIVPVRTSARLQEGMTGHAVCKKFELSRVVFGEILRGLPTDINIPLRGQPK